MIYDCLYSSSTGRLDMLTLDFGGGSSVPVKMIRDAHIMSSVKHNLEVQCIN